MTVHVTRLLNTTNQMHAHTSCAVCMSGIGNCCFILLHYHTAVTGWMFKCEIHECLKTQAGLCCLGCIVVTCADQLGIAGVSEPSSVACGTLHSTFLLFLVGRECLRMMS